MLMKESLLQSCWLIQGTFSCLNDIVQQKLRQWATKEANINWHHGKVMTEDKHCHDQTFVERQDCHAFYGYNTCCCQCSQSDWWSNAGKGIPAQDRGQRGDPTNTNSKQDHSLSRHRTMCSGLLPINVHMLAIKGLNWAYSLYVCCLCTWAELGLWWFGCNKSYCFLLWNTYCCFWGEISENTTKEFKEHLLKS